MPQTQSASPSQSSEPIQKPQSKQLVSQTDEHEFQYYTPPDDFSPEEDHLKLFGTSDSHPGLIDGIKRIYKSGKYSDVQVIIGDRSLQAHKAVLCSQSAVLAAALDGSFKEGRTARLNLTPNGTIQASLLIQFLYSGDYADIEDPDPDPDPTETKDTDPATDVAPEDDDRSDYCPPVPRPRKNLLIHIDMWRLGDKYAIPALCHKAAKKYSRILKIERWDNGKFLDTIQPIYECSHDTEEGSEMRSLVVKYLRQHANDILGSKIASEKFDGIAEGIGEFSRMFARQGLATLGSHDRGESREYWRSTGRTIVDDSDQDYCG
ncbi:uncharacterized protein KY384_006166 [Bacidia gigantensis]|uniref:uncharacterized protein n=1 Tax=Bacidia gigantensis TaxID=2732470 RepID=UPI001D04A23A|nr:uncharacterized protein KY384_006166 [Bacidia gigantensis]KAG8529529.1 hypothetical protein KY384_006166 [Bacidia gigantensis]